MVERLHHTGTGTGTGNTLGLVLYDTLLPSLKLHSSLSLVTYAIARATDRAELKDWLWPSGMVINTWAAFIADRTTVTTPLGTTKIGILDAFGRLAWTEKLLLTGVTAWGVRLFYRIASRGIRRGRDDPRYELAKKSDSGFWNKALFSSFLPEAVFQTLITLPFTLPFRSGLRLGGTDNPAVSLEYSTLLRAVAVGLFCTGFAMETLSDHQIEAHKKKKGDQGLCGDGVWSIVRHPNYLGDFLTHLSFPILLLSSPSTVHLNPLLTFLGPLTNYIFLRYVGGDRENEAQQETRYSEAVATAEDTQATQAVEKLMDLQQSRTEKNSFWPDAKQVVNKWTWVVVGIGAAGALIEGIVRP